MATRNPGPPPLPKQQSHPLDMSLLADLPSLDLRARYVMNGFLSGRHRSPRKGSSVEFAEYRDYQFGDDLRRIDWRLYGRTGRLHVKQFEEETQLRVFLILDTSASMNYRSKDTLLTKLDYGRVVLAALALLAQRQQDSFGLGLAGQNLHEFLSSASSLSHWRRFLARIDTVMLGGPTSLAHSLGELADLVPPRSLIIIASDFYEEPEALRASLRRLRYDRHDLLGLHVLDPFEVTLDQDAQGTFIDAESDQRLILDAEAVRGGYLERFAAFCSECDASFRDVGGDFQQLATDQSPLSALAAYLAARNHLL